MSQGNSRKKEDKDKLKKDEKQSVPTKVVASPKPSVFNLSENLIEPNMKKASVPSKQPSRPRTSSMESDEETQAMFGRDVAKLLTNTDLLEIVTDFATVHGEMLKDLSEAGHGRVLVMDKSVSQGGYWTFDEYNDPILVDGTTKPYQIQTLIIHGAEEYEQVVTSSMNTDTADGPMLLINDALKSSKGFSNITVTETESVGASTMKLSIQRTIIPRVRRTQANQSNRQDTNRQPVITVLQTTSQPTRGGMIRGQLGQMKSTYKRMQMVAMQYRMMRGELMEEMANMMDAFNDMAFSDEVPLEDEYY